LIYEGTDHLKAALSSGMTSLEGIVALSRRVGWRRNKEVTLLYVVLWPSTPSYRVKTEDSKRS